VSESADTVRRWVETTMGWAPDRFGVYPAPHLSTPHYELVMIDQKAVRHGGELYVMTDGSQVLPAGAENLGKVLAAEGPLPAELVAELFFRMAEVGRGRPVGDARAERDGDGMRYEFSSERGFRGPVEHWTLRVASDGTLSTEVVTPQSAPGR
jgi:hypothetical protein